MVLTWLEALNDWLPPHLLPNQDNLVVITAGKVSWQAEKQFTQQDSRSLSPLVQYKRAPHA